MPSCCIFSAGPARASPARALEATGGDGGLAGESCTLVAQGGPVPGGIGGLGLPPTDRASLGLNAEAHFSGNSSTWSSAACPSTPIGGNGGGKNVAGAGGNGGSGASSSPGTDGSAGVVLVFFLH